MGRGHGDQAPTPPGWAGIRSTLRTVAIDEDAPLRALGGFRRPDTEEDLWSLAPFVVLRDGSRRYAVKPVETTRHYDDAIKDLLIGHGRGYSYQELADVLAGAPWGRHGTGLTKADLGGKSDKPITAEDIRQDVPHLVLRLDAPISLRREPNPRDGQGNLIYEPVTLDDGRPVLDDAGAPRRRLVQGKWRLQLLDAAAGAAELDHIRSYEQANRAAGRALRETANGAEAVMPDEAAAVELLRYLAECRKNEPADPDAVEPVRSAHLEAALDLSDVAVRKAVACARAHHWPLVWDGRRGYCLLRRSEVESDAGRARLLASADSLDGRGDSQLARSEDFARALDAWYGAGAGRRDAYTDRSKEWAARHDARVKAVEQRKAAVQAAAKGHQEEAATWARRQLVQYEDDLDLLRANASLTIDARDRGIAALGAAEACGELYGDEAAHHRWTKIREYREYLLLAKQGWLPRSMRRPGTWHDEVLDASCWRDVKSDADKRLAKSERGVARKREQNERIRRRERRAAENAAKPDRSRAAALLGLGEAGEAELARDLAARASADA